jgi:hypothetical protein
MGGFLKIVDALPPMFGHGHANLLGVMVANGNRFAFRF